MRFPALSVVLLAACAKTPDPRILTAAREYSSYGRVSDRLAWAPTDCEAPAPSLPRQSLSHDAETHGRKLYHLYAKDFEAYRLGEHRPQPLGQVLVKEAWLPASGSTMSKPRAGERGPLFMMMKTGEADSDGGWIYATLTPDGKTLTGYGKMASCMECHQPKEDRLFGIKSCAGAR